MALKVIATAADALVILGLMRGQIKQKDKFKRRRILGCMHDLCNEYYDHLEITT
nr:MAG TPA: hypothetical protein [Caudoviricetes sp.]